MKGHRKIGRGLWLRPDSPYIQIVLSGINKEIIRKSSRTDKVTVARALRTKWKAQINQGIDPFKKVPQGRGMTFDSLAREYMKWTNQKSGDKSRDYRIKTMMEYFDETPLKSLSILALEKYQSSLMTKGLKPASVNRNIILLKTMLRKAVDWEMLPDEFAMKLRKIKDIPGATHRNRFASLEELDRLLIEAEFYPTRTAVMTALNTGFRKSEILTLQWVPNGRGHVDMKHRYFILERTKTHARREIYMNDIIFRVYLSLPRWHGVPWVFYNPSTNDRFKSIDKGFKNAVKRAGIADFHFHDLRHTAASHLAMSGEDLYKIMKFLGHKNIQTTMRYAHLSPAFRAGTSEKLVEIYSELSQKLGDLGFEGTPRIG